MDMPDALYFSALAYVHTHVMCMDWACMPPACYMYNTVHMHVWLPVPVYAAHERGKTGLSKAACYLPYICRMPSDDSFGAPYRPGIR